MDRVKLLLEPMAHVHHDGRRGRMLHVVAQRGHGRSCLVGLEGWLPKCLGGPGGWYCLLHLKVSR